MNAPVIKGWCPGAVRPMLSGDGLLVRLKISGGCVDIALAREIATWSRNWGNGAIDLSTRANLQLRGVRDETLSALQDALAARGLLEEAGEPEAARNIIVSPLAGLDPDAALDARAPAAALRRHLVGDARLRALPGKFGFVVDDGGLFDLGALAADVCFTALRTPLGSRFMLRLAGSRERFGFLETDALAAVAAAVCHAFLAAREGRASAIRRMSDLVNERGAEAIAAQAGLQPSPPPHTVARAANPSRLLGAHPLGEGAFVGVGLPFGRMDAEAFDTLACAAAAQGARELRLTSWRALLAPLPSMASARTLAATLAGEDFILNPDDPRLRVAACPGAPECAQGEAPARRDAGVLAEATAGAPGSDILLHVSGCAKGCAHPQPAPIALIGRNGRYDLAVSGAALAHGLTVDEAAAAVRRVVAQGQAA